MGAISSRHYHAHVYFEASQLDIARRLHRELARLFPVQMGRIFAVPIGPHPKPMFQVIFHENQFAAVVQWLLHNRQGLDVLVHGLSGDDLKDHSELTLWLGKSHTLDFSVLDGAS